MSAKANKALYLTMMKALSAHDIDTAATMFAEDFTWHGPGGLDLTGVPAWHELIVQYFSAFPDLELTVGEVVADETLVAAHWSASGTHQGVLGGIEATGRAVHLVGNHMFRIEDGKFAEEWETLDELGMLQQIGAIPAPTS